MKKILSVLLVCIMLFSSVSIIACADTVQYYRDGLFEFYLEDGGAHIVNVLSSASQTTELTIPLRLCYDADKKISAPTLSSIVDDDNDAPDPFGSDYAYVTAVEEGALDSYISTLTTLSISRYVEDFDYNELLFEATELTAINVDEHNTYFTSSAGTLYSGDGKTLLVHPQASADNSILSTTTAFAPSAFQNSALIESITIPAGVTGISEHCFDACSALKTVDFTAAKLGNIGSYAFANTALESVNLGSYMKLVNSFAFFGCSSLSSLTIPQNAKNVVLGSGSFIGCPIKKLTVYRSVIEVGDHAIGYYYDSDLSLKAYDDLVVTSYKFNEEKSATTPLYQYVKANDIKFIPLDDIYTVQYTYEQLAGVPATMYLYKNGDLKYTADSESGVFTVEFAAAATYDVYFLSKFGLLIKVDTVSIKATDYKEEYIAQVEKYEPIGEVLKDGVINIKDISLLLKSGNFMSANDSLDIDMDGIVGISDVSIVLMSRNYGKIADSITEDYDTPIIPLP